MCKTANALIELAKFEPDMAIRMAGEIVREKRIQGEPVSSELSYIAGYNKALGADFLLDDFEEEFG